MANRFERYCFNCSNRARYSAVTPKALPQSLAKRTARESGSHAGDPLVQFPPVRRSAFPLATSRSQICCDPVRSDVKATHLPSGETEESFLPIITGNGVGSAFPVDEFNRMMVDLPCATSSK